MPVLQVLMDENGDVLGTARVDEPAGVTPDAPVRASMVAGAGQSVVEVTVDDEVAGYEPEALHRAIRSQQAK
jgi:hypothetical protein